MTDDPIKLFVVVMAILLCVLGFVSYASYGQAAALNRPLPAGELMGKLVEETREVLGAG